VAVSPDCWCQIIRTNVSDLAFDHGRREQHDRGYGCKIRFWIGTVIYTGDGDGANALLARLRPEDWPKLRPLPEPLAYDYVAAFEREQAARAERNRQFAMLGRTSVTFD